MPVKLHVSSLPIADVVRDLAQELGENLECESNIYRLQLSSRHGRGEILGTDYGNGVGMITYRCTFLHDVEICFDLDQVHPVKFIYAYAGSFVHRFDMEVDSAEVSTHRNLLVASSEQDNHILLFKGGQPLELFSVEIDRKNFTPRFSETFASSEDRLQKLLLDTKAKSEFLYLGDYTLRSYDLIRQIFAFKRKGVLRFLFYEAKSYEVLVEQWLQYADDQHTSGKRTLIRRVDVDRIKIAIAFIHANLAQDLNTTTISKEVGLNQRNLQAGFRELTGFTVNRYVREQRFLEALRLLRTGRYNVTETLLRVGLSSQSYFSRKFKERWGVSPSAYRRLLREEE